MKVPFLVLSYGDFAKTKKLFSYERYGVHTFPIFTDADAAYKFIGKMNVVLAEMKDYRKLQTQVCTDPVKAFEMMQTVTVYCPDLMHIIVDPSPVTRDDDTTDLTDMKAVEDVRDIDDFMLDLQELATGPSASKTP